MVEPRVPAGWESEETGEDPIQKSQVHRIMIDNLDSLLDANGDWLTLEAFPHLPGVQIEDVILTFVDADALTAAAGASHVHDAIDITTGVFVPGRLGTGFTGPGDVLYGGGWGALPAPITPTWPDADNIIANQAFGY